jgi:hypothetical protein
MNWMAASEFLPRRILAAELGASPTQILQLSLTIQASSFCGVAFFLKLVPARLTVKIQYFLEPAAFDRDDTKGRKYP